MCISRCLFVPDSMTLAKLQSFEKQKRHPILRTGFHRTKKKEAGHIKCFSQPGPSLFAFLSPVVPFFIYFFLLSFFILHIYILYWKVISIWVIKHKSIKKTSLLFWLKTRVYHFYIKAQLLIWLFYLWHLIPIHYCPVLNIYMKWRTFTVSMCVRMCVCLCVLGGQGGYRGV